MPQPRVQGMPPQRQAPVAPPKKFLPGMVVAPLTQPGPVKPATPSPTVHHHVAPRAPASSHDGFTEKLSKSQMKRNRKKLRDGRA